MKHAASGLKLYQVCPKLAEKGIIPFLSMYSYKTILETDSKFEN